MIRCALLLLACALPSAAAGSEWVRFAASAQGDEAFLDRDTLEVRGELRTVWMRVEKAEPAVHEGRPLKTWFAQEQVLCRHGMERTLRRAGYTPDGALVFEAEFGAAEFRSVAEQGAGAARLKAICGLAPPRRKPA